MMTIDSMNIIIPPWLPLLLLSTIWRIDSFDPPTGVYCHIPFCRRRCYYCDFPVNIIGDRKSTIERETDLYTNILLKEIDSSIPYIKKSNIDSLYFGGGTPSLLSVDNVQKIIKFVNNKIGLTDNCEITIEMDPGTFDFDKLQQLSAVGINRVSLGIQSFHDNILRSCGRAHTSSDITLAISNLKESSIENFNIDLISSLPNSTHDLWVDTLQQACQCGATHISIYDLQIEDGTAFGHWYKPGEFPLPNEEDSANMFRTAAEILKKNGFEHYEVSNYARPGYRSRHNQKYWNCEPVYGFGMGAASYVNGVRFTRPKKMEDYIQWVNSLITPTINTPYFSENTKYNNLKNDVIIDGNSDSRFSNGNSDLAGPLLYYPKQYINENGVAVTSSSSSSSSSVISAPSSSSSSSSHDILEVVMLSLRTTDGLNLNKISRLFGDQSVTDILNALFPYILSGHVEKIETAPGDYFVRLTDPEGFLISNDIISSIFAVLPDKELK